MKIQKHQRNGKYGLGPVFPKGHRKNSLLVQKNNIAEINNKNIQTQT